MPETLPVLYVKTGCPWCAEVSSFLTEQGIGFRELNVTEDLVAREQMLQVSQQTKVPVLDWDGKIIADFGVDELKPFLHRQNVKIKDD